MRNHKLLSLAALMLTFTFQSCQKGELTELHTAQLCLNTASAGAARACVTSIASNTTEYANSLRCSAIFISEGFSTPAQFINALNAINGSGCGGGCSPTLNALGTLNFGSNSTVANEAFTTCSKSGVKFYTQISSMFKMGTLAVIAAGVSNPTASQIETNLGTMPSSELGELATTAHASVCSDLTNASNETKQYCNDLSVALLAGSSSTAIGDCLKARLADPTKTTCP